MSEAAASLAEAVTAKAEKVVARNAGESAFAYYGRLLTWVLTTADGRKLLKEVAAEREQP